MFTLHNGDCLEYMKSLQPENVVCISDPPYGIGWNTDYNFGIENSSAPYAKNMVRKSHEKIINDEVAFDPTPFLVYKTVILWGCNYFMDKLPSGSLLIWDKRANGGKAFMTEAEAAWCSKVGAVKMFTHCWQGFSRASENSQHYHPTQKPVALMGWCIENFTEVGDTVFDPFMGSGSTGVACMQLGRNFIGCELDPKYYSIAEKRIKSAALQPGLFTPSNNRVQRTGGESGQQSLFSAGEVLPAKVTRQSTRR